MAETLKKGTLPLLKDQVREFGLRARPWAEGLSRNECPCFQRTQKSQDFVPSDLVVLCQLMSIKLVCGNSLDI